MNQVAGNQMRLYDLPSKLLCRVLNVELKVPSSSRRVHFFLPSPGFLLPIPHLARQLPLRRAIPGPVLTRFPGFGRRRRTPTRSTRRSCSCQSPR